jgi:hypothetical protein
MSFLEGKGKRHAAAKLAETGHQTRPPAVGRTGGKRRSTESLIQTISRWENTPEPQRGDWQYYDHWVAAVEKVIAEPGWASVSPAFDDDFLWHRQDTFHDSFCRDLDDIESLVMATQVLELITNAAASAI